MITINLATQTIGHHQLRYADFEHGPAGRLIATVHGAKAFVPNPLPPTLDYGRIALNLASAMAAMGELRGACRRLPNPYILIRPLQRLEAQTSSAMEGTCSTVDELVLAEAEIGMAPTSDAGQVRNYLIAGLWCCVLLASLLKNSPMSGYSRRQL